MSAELVTKDKPAKTPFSTLSDALIRSKDQLAKVLPKHLTADRMVRIAISAAAKNPQLLQCTITSVLQSVMQAAQLGLEPGGALGAAYLVPYKNKRGSYDCQLIISYRGLIELARRSGQIQSLEAHVVYAKDKFVCKYGLSPVLEHEPDWSEDPGEIRAVYAVAHLVGGGTQCEVMTMSQVNAIRARARTGASGPWSTDFAEMARKTVVRKLCKYLPISVDIANAAEIEDRAEGIDTSSTNLDDIHTETLTAAEKLKNKLTAKNVSDHAQPSEPATSTAQDYNPETGEVYGDVPEFMKPTTEREPGADG